MAHVVRLLEQGLVLCLGAAAYSFMWSPLRRVEPSFLWKVGGPVVVLALAAGLVEAAAVRRTGRQRWLASWLPSVLVMFAVLVAQHMSWQARYGAYAAPDAGMAMGLEMAAFLAGVPVFALLVNLIAAVGSRVPGRWAPQASPVGQPVWSQAGVALLQVHGQHWWLPVSRATMAALAGIQTFAWANPNFTLELFAGYAIADGVLAVATSILNRDRSATRWWPAKAGVLGIGCGILTLLWPLAVLALIPLVLVSTTATGIVQIAGAIRWRSHIRNEWLIGLTGAVSVLFGIVPLYILKLLTV